MNASLVDDRAFGSDRPPTCLTARLHHLALGTPQPAELAEFYRFALGYEPFEVGGVIGARAADRNLLFVPGTAKTLSWAGFVLPNAEELERLRSRIDAAGWPRTDGPTAFFSDAVKVCDPDGNALVFGIVIDTDQERPPALADAHARAGWSDDQLRQARIQHVVVASRNPDAIVRFFEDVLGFTLSDTVVDGEGGVRTSFLRCSNEHHSFAVFKAAEDRLDHHCYEAADWNAIRDWADHMADRHIRLQWGPGRHGPGNNLFIFVHDPDGNWVEISAELEIVRHDRPAGTWPHAERTLNSWGQGLLRS